MWCIALVLSTCVLFKCSRALINGNIEGDHPDFNDGRDMFLSEKKNFMNTMYSSEDIKKYEQIGFDMNSLSMDDIKTVMGSIRDVVEPSQCSVRIRRTSIPNKNKYRVEPKCIDIPRCPDTCGDKYECVALDSHFENKTFVHLSKTGGYLRKFNQEVLIHDSCKSQCRVKPKDCTAKQYHREFYCDCVCKESLRSCPRNQHFDKDTCQCECDEKIKRKCVSPNRYTYDKETCSCQRIFI